MELKNSTILITGGTSGIGLEFAKQLTDQNANIIVTGRNLNALNETKKAFPKIHTFQSDLSNPKDIEKALNLGADAYVTKPYSIKKLIQQTEEMLG